MEPLLEYLQEKTIVGVALRTNNERESNPETSSIPIMWRNFFDYNIIGSIPDAKDSSTVYGLYYDYESNDSNAEYTLLIGLESGASTQPPNLALGKIEEGNYLVFKVLEATPTGIKDTWAGVEGYFNEVGKHTRKFTSDFEIYQGRDEIAIYISIL